MQTYSWSKVLIAQLRACWVKSYGRPRRPSRQTEAVRVRDSIELALVNSAKNLIGGDRCLDRVALCEPLGNNCCLVVLLVRCSSPVAAIWSTLQLGSNTCTRQWQQHMAVLQFHRHEQSKPVAGRFGHPPRIFR